MLIGPTIGTVWLLQQYSHCVSSYNAHIISQIMGVHVHAQLSMQTATVAQLMLFCHCTYYLLFVVQPPPSVQ